MINKFKKFLESRDNFSHLNDFLDDYSNYDYGNYSGSEYKWSDRDDSGDNPEFYNTKTQILHFFKNYRIYGVTITGNLHEICVEIEMAKRLPMNHIINIFEVLYLLHSDILPEYDTELVSYDSGGKSYIQVIFEIDIK